LLPRILLLRTGLATLLAGALLALAGCGTRERPGLGPASGGGEEPTGTLTAAEGEAPGAPDPDDPITPPQYNVGGAPGLHTPAHVPVVPGEIVVRLEPGQNEGKFHQSWGTSTILQTADGSLLMEVSGGSDPWGWVEEMRQEQACEHVEPNFVAEAPESHQGTLPFFEADHQFSDVVDQDALLRIGIPAAHQVATGSGVIVAVIDTGVDATHPALTANVLTSGRDFIDDDFDPHDERVGLDSDGDGLTDEAAGHGTHVAGLVVAVAPDAMILPVRALDSEGNGTSIGVARAIRWAADAGADVINLSLGLYIDADPIKRAVQDVEDLGVVVVNAAGNGGMRGDQHFPSRMSKVISVAATDSEDGRAEFSNYGTSVSVSAPGEGILSTFLDHAWAVWSGTSMAAPFVSGAAALYLQDRPWADAQDVHDAIVDTAAPLDLTGTPWDGKMGEGLLDCEALVGL
jgi:subtilisin family serine protease